MLKSEVMRAMAAAEIVGRVFGSGEQWEVEVLDDAARDRFVACVANVGATPLLLQGWRLKPMQQAELPFGTLDSAVQRSLF